MTKRAAAIDRPLLDLLDDFSAAVARAREVSRTSERVSDRDLVDKLLTEARARVRAAKGRAS